MKICLFAVAAVLLVPAAVVAAVPGPQVKYEFSYTDMNDFADLQLSFVYLSDGFITEDRTVPVADLQSCVVTMPTAYVCEAPIFIVDFGTLPRVDYGAGSTIGEFSFGGSVGFPDAALLTPGFYTNGGAAQDRFATLRVSQVSGAVPEPASWAMLITGFGPIGAALRRRQRAAAGKVGEVVRAA